MEVCIRKFVGGGGGSMSLLKEKLDSDVGI